MYSNLNKPVIELIGIYTVTKIKKKTKAKFFEHIKEGDILEFKTVVANITLGRSMYAPMVKVCSIFDKETTIEKSFSELSNLLSNNFELEEI